MLSGLSEGRFFYDDAKAQKAIRYIETFCRHHEGALAPQLIVLELWQKAFLSVVFGIVDANGFRQFTEIVLIIGAKKRKKRFLLRRLRPTVRLQMESMAHAFISPRRSWNRRHYVMKLIIR